MSISVDLHFCNIDQLLADLKTWAGGAWNEDMALAILNRCGTFLYDEYGKQVYLLVNNEYYEDDNPFYNVANLFDHAFGKEDSFDCFLDAMYGEKGKEGITYLDLEETAEVLGITLEDGESDDE